MVHGPGAGGPAVTCRDPGKPIRAAETNGSYLNEFRRHQSVDTSYIKQVSDLESVSNTVVPPLNLLYVGWTGAGEWFSLTVEAAEEGCYNPGILYTAHHDAGISISINDDPAPLLSK